MRGTVRYAQRVKTTTKAGHTAAPRPLRALRGLALGLSLSVANLIGAFLTLTVLGGLGSWTGTQFIALFGLIEIGTGAAFVIGPNIWRLPAAAAELEPGTEVRFAASTIFIPHWAGGVKAIAGAVLVAWTAAHEGVTPATAGILLLIAAACATAVGASMLAARAGVAYPGIDVFQFVVRRPGRPDHELPAQSLGASLIQMVLNICTFPSVKLLSPSALYQPELAPSPALLAWATAFGGGLLLLGFAAWWGRLAWRAPRAQQREAEQEFAATSP